MLAVTCNIKFLLSVRRFRVNPSVVLSLAILLTLMMEALRSSEASVLIRTRRRDIPQGRILRYVFFVVK
jgi:hypothetical protein